MRNYENLLILNNINPLLILENLKLEKSKLKDFKNKSGVYLWYNNLTHDYYIGSSINLFNRLNQYFYIIRLKKNQRINRAILK